MNCSSKKYKKSLYFILLFSLPLIFCFYPQKIVNKNLKDYQQLSFKLGKMQSSNDIHFGGNFLFYGLDDSRTNLDALDSFNNTFYDIGMEFARFDIYWGLLEPQNDIYNWTLLDDLMNTLPDVEVLLTIYSSNSWGSMYNYCRDAYEAAVGQNRYNGPPSSIPINMQDYLDFLEDLVNRYKHRVKYWQIENEVYGAKIQNDIPGCDQPMNLFWIGSKEEYLTLLTESYSKIKEIDLEATVICSSIAFGTGWTPDINLDYTFLDYILNYGRNYTDRIDLHLYHDIESVTTKINFIKQKLSNLGYDKALWCTESGEIDIEFHKESIYQTSFNSPEELHLQSEEIIKRHVVAFANGIERINRLRLNSMRQFELSSSNWPHMSLTFDIYGIDKKPGYYTYKLMTDKLEGFISVEKINDFKNVYKFIMGTSSIIIAWNEITTNYDLTPYISSDNVIITHIITEQGKSEPIIDNSLTDSIEVSNSPIIIEISENSSSTDSNGINGYKFSIFLSINIICLIALSVFIKKNKNTSKL